jgi:hypothetical protein
LLSTASPIHHQRAALHATLQLEVGLRRTQRGVGQFATPLRPRMLRKLLTGMKAMPHGPTQRC